MSLSTNNNEKVIHNIANNSLKASRTRNIFTILTITLAISFIIVMGLSTMNYRNYEKQILAKMQDCMYYNLNEEQINGIKENENVDSVTLVKQGAPIIKNNIKMLPSYCESNQIINLYTITEGKYPINKNEIVIDVALAKDLKVDAIIGNTIELPNGEKFKICGFTDYGIITSEYDILLSKEYAETGELLKDNLFDALIKVSSDLYIPSREFIKNVLYNIGGENNVDNKYINVNNRYIDSFKVDTNEVITLIALSIAILIVSGVVIYSIFYLSVSSRIKDFGQLRCIGMSKKQLRKLIKIEGLKYCKYGIPLGIIIGGIISYFVSPDGYSVGNVIGLSIVAVVFGVITILISVGKPAKIASQISPIEALRHTSEDVNIKKSKNIHRKLNVISLGKIGFERNKKKTIITLISLVIGGTLFITGSIFVDSWSFEDYARNGQFKEKEYTIKYIYENNEELYNLQKNNSLAKIEQKLLQILEVEKIEEEKVLNVKLDFNNEKFEDTLQVIEKDKNNIMKKYLEEGTGNYDELVKNNQIYVIANDLIEEAYGWKFNVGDKIVFEFFDEETKIIEYEVGGISNSKYGRENLTYSTFIIPEDLLNNLNLTVNVIEELNIYTKNNVYGGELDNKIEEIAISEKNVIVETFTDHFKNSEDTAKSASSFIIGISMFIIIFSLINLINTVITNTISRKKELAVLQSMGMTVKQIKQMLIFENFYTAVPNIIISNILGTILGYVLINTFSNFGVTYLHFSLPIVSMIIYLIMSILVPTIISIICIKLIRKESVINRLRQVA